MGGIRGKSAKRRAKMALNTKTFDRISGRFYDEKVVMPSAKVSQEAMLSAPKSFKRFLAAKRAIEVREKRSRGPKVEAGDDDDDDEDDDADKSENEIDDDDDADTKKQKIEATATSEEDDDIKPLVRAKPDQGTEELRALDEKTEREQLEKEKAGKKKKKHMSLRERKRRDRAALRAEKQEEEAFLRGTGGGVRFGETAEAPPTITLKRKSGGKGEKEVPIAQSGHKIVQIADMHTGGKSNRQTKIFEELLSAAQKDSTGGKTSKKSKSTFASDVGLKRQHDLAQLRAQVISDYRQMKGRPMTNGRNEKLANNPVKLFAGVSAAQLRRDRRPQ
jgi:hypothetical protein